MIRNSNSHAFCETDYRDYHVSEKYINCTEVHSKQRPQTRLNFWKNYSIMKNYSLSIPPGRNIVGRTLFIHRKSNPTLLPP